MTILCALYARISNEVLQTAEDKVSIETQLADCRAHAARLGAVVVSEYVDDRRYRDARGVLVDPAGWRADRPAWRALLEAAGRGEFALVIAWHSTRLFRGYRPMSDLIDVAERHKLSVECVKDSFNLDLAPIYAWAAKQERQAFAARSAMGKLGRARRGLPTTRAPAHYEKVVDFAGRTVGYRLRDEARPWLAEIARLYLDGHGLNHIARVLARNPITGTRLSPQRVADVLENPFNYGIVAAYRYAAGGSVGDFAGTHEPAWEPATCAALRAEHDRRRVPARAKVRGTALFSGVVRCGLCGRVLSVTQSGRRPHIYKQYVCWWAASYKDHLRVSVTETKLIRLVRQQFAAVSDDALASAVSALTPAPAMSADMIVGLEQRRDELRAHLAELEADLSAVRSPAARQAVAGQVAEAQAELAGVEGQIDRAGQGTALLDPGAILERIKRLRDDPDIWHLPFAELRGIIVRALPALYVLRGQLVPGPQGELG